MDLTEIKKKINEDKEKTLTSYRRYPVRFLFFEMSNDTQNDILELVKSTNGELLDLSDFIMKKDDGWLTKSRFVHIINSRVSDSKDTYVLGFSELIRFFSKKEIESTVLSLFDIENTDIVDKDSFSRRIYFVCFSMFDSVYNVLQKSFPRKDLIDPFLNNDFEISRQYREVCFVSADYANSIVKNKITSSVEWIGLWRHAEIIDFSQPIWCCSNNLYDWHKKASPDNAFQIDVVNNAKDYILKANGIPISFAYFDDEKKNWDELKDICSKYEYGTEIKDILANESGVEPNSTVSLASKYLNTDNPFELWFLRKYVCEYLSDSFLAFIFSTTKKDSKKELLTNIWKQGYWTQNKNHLEERSEIIKELNKYTNFVIPEKEIWKSLSESMNKDLSINLLSEENDSSMRMDVIERTGANLEDVKKRATMFYFNVFRPAYMGISSVEKEFVIYLFSNDIIGMPEIKEIYPSFHSYMSGNAEKQINDKDNCKLYLDAYRKSKVHGKDIAYLKNYYESGKANASNIYDIYYEIPHQEVAISPFLKDSDLYIFDGVGAEYLPVLVYLIQKNSYEVEFCDYATCHLPSITDVNKGYLSKMPYKEWFLYFDQQVIHGEFYRLSCNMRKALDILEQKVKEIINDASGRRIVITADHGATARAKWVETKKKYDFSDSDHEGRCCKVTDKSEYSDTEDYIVYEDEVKPGDPYLISLNETSLYNRPKYEDHGGATLEELLVPIIVARKPISQNAKTFVITPEKLVVTGLDKSVSFIINPDPDTEISIVERNGDEHLLVKQGLVYTAELNVGIEQEITIIILDKEYKFRTVNKSKKNMEGDDGFDD